MMQMLQAGGVPVLADGVRAADEDNPRGYLEYEAVKRTKTDASWLEDAGGRAVKMVHLLLRDLPEGRRYRVIFMQRDLDEVVASQRVMLDRAGRAGAALPEAQLRSLYERQYDEMRDWLSSRPGFDVLWVNYNALLAAPAPHIAAIDDFLGGDLDTDAMAAVIDPDLYRQRASSAGSA